MSEYVLDASALLAAMLGEAGADQALEVMPTAKISAVSLSEVVAKLQERNVPDTIIELSLAELDLDVVAFDSAQSLLAGKLRAPTRNSGLSLGDRACLALAMTLGAVAVTADSVWAKLDIGVKIKLIR